MNRQEFLAELWPDGLESDDRLVLWSKVEFAGAAYSEGKNGPSWMRWCATLGEVPEPPDVDLYYGVSLQPASEEAPGRRGSAATARASAGVHLDLDVGAKPGAKKRYPPTLKDAIRVLAALPLPPSHVVSSGGPGLHAYWLWREPWRFEDAEDRRRCARLVAAWQRLVRRRAEELGGWAVDSTHDLARVMRLPRTTHGRSGELALAVDATHGLAFGSRYNPSEVFDALVLVGEDPEAEPRAGAARRSAGVGEAEPGPLLLNPSAVGPTDVLEEVRALDSGFDRAWSRKGPATWSQSEYDLSIATRLLAVGVPEQAVIDALIQHRREGGAPPKLRQDYYAGTLLVARRRGQGEPGRSTESAIGGGHADGGAAPGLRGTNGHHHETAAPVEARSAREVLAIDSCAPGSAEPPADPREAARSLVREKLGVELARVLRYPAADERGSFALELGDGRRVAVGPVDALLGQAKLGLRIAEATLRLPPARKRAEWMPVCRALLALVEDVPVGPQGELGQLMAEWISDWISGRTIPTRDEATTGMPHVHDGATWLRLEDLGQYLWTHRRERLTSRELAHRLRAAGWEPEKARIGVRSVNFWRRAGIFGSDEVA